MIELRWLIAETLLLIGVILAIFLLSVAHMTQKQLITELRIEVNELKKPIVQYHDMDTDPS